MIENNIMTPREIVEELDKFIIGQKQAKRAVAIALRNRWRRLKIKDASLRGEIMPKNILMIGPTGVGKTEIARRLSKLADAPFVKVEATKFTEVGYVGRDVESIVRDLVDIAIKQEREDAIRKVKTLSEELAEERILDALLPEAKSKFVNEPKDEDKGDSSSRKLFRQKLRSKLLDDKEIEIDMNASPSIGVEIMSPPGMEEMTSQLQSMFKNMSGNKKKRKKIKVGKAIKLLQEEEAAKLVNEDDIKNKALERVEQSGIVFIDEIDKIAKRSDGMSGGAEVSREGVQRDLLPLVEGSTVFTKYGIIKTDHILFIGSGAFHVSKPSDLVPELQGRFPIRVELQPLTAGDFERILTEPDASLTQQYTALMETENLHLNFTNKAIKKLAELAWKVNERTENIGARRLHTIMEKLLDEVSFDATDIDGDMNIDEEYVDKHLSSVVKDEDLSRYIL